jgi:hypothetical protein
MEAPTKNAEYIRLKASEIFTKYKDMSDRGEKRANGSPAMHPKKWGIGLIFETSEKISASKAWTLLTPDQKAGWAQGAKHLKTTKRQAFIHVYNS